MWGVGRRDKNETKQQTNKNKIKWQLQEKYMPNQRKDMNGQQLQFGKIFNQFFKEYF